MHILIAPNAFKGSLSATEAARCIAEGIQRSNLSCDLTLFPVADGGNDTLSLLVDKMNAELIQAFVHDPLGRPIKAYYGWIKSEKKAIIGISEASGLHLLKKEEYDPLHANSYGSGELIKAALGMGVQKILIGVGGSATVDGATGLLRALGVKFLNENGEEIIDLPAGLLRLNSIDISALDHRLDECEIIVLCDVKNQLLGDEGAAKVYGPQKGANEKEIILLEQCLEQLNNKTSKIIGVNMNEWQYGGAAGGIAAGLAAYAKAELVNGIEYFLDITGFDQALEKADLVITGEGSIDEQTLTGKGPLGVAIRAKAKGIPVIAMAGNISPGKKMNKYFDHLISINPPGISLENAMRNTAANLSDAAYKISCDLNCSE